MNKELLRQLQARHEKRLSDLQGKIESGEVREADLDSVNEEIDGLIDELKAIKAELGDDNSESGDGKGDDGTAKSDNKQDIHQCIIHTSLLRCSMWTISELLKSFLILYGLQPILVMK